MSTTTENRTEPRTEASVVEKDAPEPSSRRDRVLTWALPLVALCVLAAGLVTWWRASGHDKEMVDEAARRDRVLIVATSHIETLNSLDYRTVDEGLKGWAAVTTGTLHDQLTSVSEDDRKVLAEQKKISTGSVMDAAVTELDDDTATVIAAVEITVRDGSASGEDADPTVKRNRFAADLVKVGDDWLLESLEQVAVNMS
jgi:Mce-associated membrane protein